MQRIILVGLLLLGLKVSAADEPTAAVKIIERYLQLPHSTNDVLDETRTVRLRTLRQLEQMPEAAAPAIELALRTVKDSRQRAELAETLRHFPNQESAAVLVELLADPDPNVRSHAIQSLRLIALRVERSGGQGTQLGQEFAPQMAGIVSNLIKAASDPVEPNRTLALFALADTGEPAAIAAIRQRLTDESSDVRFAAACLLTKFRDASGLPELKGALESLRSGKASEITMDIQCEQLLASFVRLTGKTFGPIPRSPVFMSDSAKAAEARQRSRELLDTWATWWAKNPAGQ